MNVESLKVGQELLFKGDMANLSGRGKIIEIHENERFGISYDVLLDDGRIFSRIEPIILKSGRPWVLIYEEPNINFNDIRQQISQDEKIISKAKENRLFDHGEFILTRGVSAKVQKNKEFSNFINKSLKRHISGDWGEISSEDALVNQHALEQGFRLFSAYSNSNNPKIWIITEAGRFATTVLFPNEY